MPEHLAARALSLADFCNRPRARELPHLKLQRMRKLLAMIGDPHLKLGRAVHVAGSSGKGSTSTLSAAAVGAMLPAGAKVGLFTSPHLHCITERIRVIVADGKGGVHFEPISPEDFTASEDAVWPHLVAHNADPGELGLIGFFECVTLLGLYYYAAQGMAAVVVEVGMGGRYDATNVLPASIAVLTPISMDHVSALGGTLSSIAAHKAGIIKDGVKVVVVGGGQPQEAHEAIAKEVAELGCRVVPAMEVFHEISTEVHAGYQTLRFAGRAGYPDELSVTVNLLGPYQRDNCKTALAVAEVFATQEGLKVDFDQISRGISCVGGRELPCRATLLTHEDGSLLLADGAHNEAAAASLACVIGETFGAPKHSRRGVTIVVAGTVGHNVPGIVQTLLPALQNLNAEGKPTISIVVTETKHPKRMGLAAMQEAFASAGLRVQVATDTSEAMVMSRALAGPTGVVVATGSMFLAAEAIASFLSHEDQSSAPHKRQKRT